MFAFLEKDSFPWWYPVLKWGVPFGLAAATGIGTGMLLTGSVAMPAFFGMLRWAPAFYASLEGFSSIAVLGAASSVVASTVGVLSSFILRGSLLFPLAEIIANNAQRTSQTLLSNHAYEKNQLETQRLEAERAVQQIDLSLRTMTTQYDQLKGAFDAQQSRMKSRSSQPTSAASTSGPAANDAPQPDEASGKRAKV